MGSTSRFASTTCSAFWRVARHLVAPVAFVLIGHSGLEAQEAGGSEDETCRVVARWDSSANLHAAAGGGAYLVARTVGFSRGQSVAFGIGINLAKEAYDVCGSGFDVGDLAAGSLGALAVLAIDRLVFGASGGDRRVQAFSSPANQGFSLGFRVAF